MLDQDHRSRSSRKNDHHVLPSEQTRVNTLSTLRLQSDEPFESICDTNNGRA